MKRSSQVPAHSSTITHNTQFEYCLRAGETITVGLHIRFTFSNKDGNRRFYSSFPQRTRSLLIMKGILSSSGAHLLLPNLSFSFSILAQSVCSHAPITRMTVSACAVPSIVPNAPGGDPSDGLTRDTCLPNGLCMNSQNSGKGITYWRDLSISTDWSNKGKCLNVCTESDISLEKIIRQEQPLNSPPMMGPEIRRPGVAVRIMPSAATRQVLS